MVVGTLTRNVLAKGQIVIPKTIRDMLDINVGDELTIEVQGDSMMVRKKVDAVSIFREVSEQCDAPLTVREIKRELRIRYRDVS